jgi:hypothetical protein
MVIGGKVKFLTLEEEAAGTLPGKRRAEQQRMTALPDIIGK